MVCGHRLGKSPRAGWAGRERSGIPAGAPGTKESSALPCNRIRYAFFKAHGCHEWGVGGGSGRTKEVEREEPVLSQAEGEREDWVPRVGEEDTREFPVASELASSWAC